MRNLAVFQNYNTFALVAGCCLAYCLFSVRRRGNDHVDFAQIGLFVLFTCIFVGLTVLSSFVCGPVRSAILEATSAFACVALASLAKVIFSGKVR